MTQEAKWSRKARRLYKKLFGEELPKPWRFEWNIRGMCIHHDSYLIIHESGLQTYDDYETLIHEFFHVRGYNHQPMFDEAVKTLTDQVWKLRHKV